MYMEPCTVCSGMWSQRTRFVQGDFIMLKEVVHEEQQ